MRVYRNVGDVGMVWALEDVYQCEDRNLLAGHLAMYLSKFDLAEKLYLESSSPISALEVFRAARPSRFYRLKRPSFLF